MGYIFTDGITITRENGETITLTSSDVKAVRDAIVAEYGRDSFEYYLDSLENYKDCYEEDYSEEIKIVEEMMQDDKECIWLYENIQEDLWVDACNKEIENVKYAIRCYKTSHSID